MGPPIFLNPGPGQLLIEEMQLLEFTDKGIYCPVADAYIDPWRPVGKALITHGHADHARWGHRHYLCTVQAKPVIRYRLGRQISISTLNYGEAIVMNGVRISFHPAGHIIGSAQIRLEYKGEVWVVSGDYKIEDDGLSAPFEPVKCHTFITESTFGLPVFNWQPEEAIAGELNSWWRQNQEAGRVSVLGAYALGKAQRLLRMLDPELGTIYTHGAIENTNEVIRAQGIDLPPTVRATQDIPRDRYPGQMVIAPPSALSGGWMRKFPEASTALASGWMALRGARRRRAADRGFVLSDHADWEGLNGAIEATGATRVFVTHGYTHLFARWLQSKGLQAQEASTEFEGELFENADPEEEQEL